MKVGGGETSNAVCWLAGVVSTVLAFDRQVLALGVEVMVANGCN